MRVVCDVLMRCTTCGTCGWERRAGRRAGIREGREGGEKERERGLVTSLRVGSRGREGGREGHGACMAAALRIPFPSELLRGYELIPHSAVNCIQRLRFVYPHRETGLHTQEDTRRTREDTRRTRGRTQGRTPTRAAQQTPTTHTTHCALLAL